MTIQILPSEIAAKIAAGEVIERPASVVKELVENAIDAGAESISIEVAQAGKRLIRVSDDGCGIPTEEVEIAFARHATSKLRTAEDLARIRTLGFRGEALASIAAVSHLTLSTRTAEEALGTEIRLEGGQVRSVRRLGRPLGTIVQVEHLFFNTPARLRFLRTDTTEAGHIARLASNYALAYPEKRFTFTKGSRTALQTYGTGDLSDAILAVYGLEVAEEMLPIEPRTEDNGEVRVSGYVSAPQLHRATRREITLYVNRRWIQDNSLSYAVQQAYHSLLPRDRHPIVILNITMPPEHVDVNIHPTKQEVRFRDQRQVFAAVQRAVRSTLMAHHSIPVVSVPGRGATEPSSISRQGAWAPSSERNGSKTTTNQDALTFQPTENEGQLPMLRVLGQISQTYIIAEGPGGMYLVDQHAAHERIRYEALKTQRATQQPHVQELLEPLPIQVTAAEADLLHQQRRILAKYGLLLERDNPGEGTFTVTAIPTGMQREQIASALSELLETADGQRESFSWEEATLMTLACHSAIRAGKTLSMGEMRELVQQLEQCALPHTCPHGRPTVIRITETELARQFQRR